MFVRLSHAVTGKITGQVCSPSYCGTSTTTGAPAIGNLDATTIIQDTFIGGYVFSVYCQQNAGTKSVQFCITSSAASYFSINAGSYTA